MKAMILAAGRGERLRPLTENVPKALVSAGGKPLIAWHLERLAASGCREAVINVSHLGERIVERLGDGARYGLAIAYSREREPLETAGGIANALGLLGEQPFLLVNGDVYCEYDFLQLQKMNLGESLAHLVLIPNPPHHPGGDFTLEAGVVGNRPAPRYTYSGIAVMSPALLAGVPAGEKAPLAPLLRAAAERRRITGELYAGVWQDVGTSERLAELEARLASKHEDR
ncbi:MAG: mannose-1-phosphate guanylyltransferase [Betaproteobacteria bacterium RIFCSPLOWO2_12_FULL_68_19]|nr:MAG: mannose-1-phosphate guanylyltransferase [Betaproteobacteria bacterium RIFCSPLOWO2_12_FULL_68_19]